MSWSVELLEFAQRDFRSLSNIQRAAVYRAFRALESAESPVRLEGVVHLRGSLKSVHVLRTDHVRIYFEMLRPWRRLVIHRIVVSD